MHKHFTLIMLFAFWTGSVSAQVFWREDFNGAGALTRWTTENSPGSKTNPTGSYTTDIPPAEIVTNEPCNNYFIINDFNTPENSPNGVPAIGTPVNTSIGAYITRFVRGHRSNCPAPSNLPNPDNALMGGGTGTNTSLHVTFQGCSDSYSFGLNEGPPDASDEYSILNADGPGTPGSSTSDQFAYMTGDISTINKCRIWLEGQFFLGGDAAGAHAYATALYSIDAGVSWKVLADNIKPSMFFIAGTCNYWENLRWQLPAECENITTLRFAFRWRNVGDQPPISTTADYTLGAGFNVDNLILYTPVPTVDFDYDSPVCRNQLVSFHNTTDMAGATGVQYRWTIAPASFSVVSGTVGSFTVSDVGPDIQFNPPASGTVYTITLEVQSCLGTHTNTENVTVNFCPPQAAFTAVNTVCSTSPAPLAGSTVDLALAATPISLYQPILSYLWTITGPGSVTYTVGSSASANPTVQLGAIGNYNVQLTVTTADGSTNLTKTIGAVNCECGTVAASSWTTIYSEGFGGYASETAPSAHTTPWTVINGPGSNSGSANIFVLSDDEAGRTVGQCGVAGGGNASLHITDVTCAGNTGAVYDAAQLTDKIVYRTAAYDFTGYTNVRVSFGFISEGEPGWDYANVQYRIGAGAWVDVSGPLYSGTGGCYPQGLWTAYSVLIPALAGQTGVNLGIRWRNDDSLGADPSFAMDNFLVEGMSGGASSAPTWVGITADWHTPGNWSTGAVPTALDNVLIPDPATLGVGMLMPVISSAEANAANVCNNGTITIGNGATNRTLNVGGFVNNFGAITSTNTVATADINFTGTACVYRGGGLCPDLDITVATGATLTLEADISCRDFTANGNVVMSNRQLTLKRNFTSAAATVLTNTGSTYLFDGPVSGTWTNPYSNPVGASVNYQYVSGAQSLSAGAAITLPTVIVRKAADANVLTVANAFVHTISTLLRIESGTMNCGARTVSGAGAMQMTGGVYRVSRAAASTQPELTGTYTLTGGTIELYNASGNVNVRQLPTGASTPYYNILHSGAGNRLITATTTVNNNVRITAGVTNAQTFILNGPASLTMIGGTLQMARVAATRSAAPTLPELTGAYALTGGTVTLTNAVAGTQYQILRQPPVGSSTGYFNVTFTSTAGTMIRYLSGDVGVSNLVTINTGTVDAETYGFSGTAGLTMAGVPCTLRVAKNSVTQPQFTGTYTLTDGGSVAASPTIEFYGDGAQTVRVLTNYRNMLFSNVGIKTLGTGITQATREVRITNGTVLVNGSTDQFSGVANLVQTGGVFRINTLQATAAIIPQFGGAYTISGGKIIVGGAGAQTLRGSTSGTAPLAGSYFDLDFNGSGVKTLNGNTNVANELSFNLPTTTGNYINAGATNILHLTNSASASLTRFGGHVVGQLRRTITGTNNYWFHVGSDNSGTVTYYEPAQLKIGTALTPTTQLTSRFEKTVPAGAPSSWGGPLTEGGTTYDVMESEGYWVTDPDAQPTSGAYSLELVPSAGWTYTKSNQTFCKRSPTLSAPLDVWGWHGSTNVTSFDRSGFAEFSEEGVVSGDAGSTFPVEGMQLTATPDQSKMLIRLEWTTHVEVNNKGFEIERSANGFDFTKIGYVSGAGNADASRRYALLDDKALPNVTYTYRLKQIDFDGAYTYSNLASARLVDASAGALASFQVYPNPFAKSVRFTWEMLRSGNADLRLYDVAGKEVAVILDDIKLEAGAQEFVWEPSRLAAGTYFYVLKTDGAEERGKLVYTR